MAAMRCWPEGEVRRGLGEAKSQGLTRAKIRRARDTTKPRPTSLDRLRYGHGTPRTHSAHTPPARPPPQADHAHVALGGQSACLPPESWEPGPKSGGAQCGVRAQPLRIFEGMLEPRWLAHNFAPDMASGEGRTGERFGRELWYHGPGTVEIRSLLCIVVHLWRRGRRLRRKPDVLLSCPCTRESASILPQSATTQMGRITLRRRRSSL